MNSEAELKPRNSHFTLYSHILQAFMRWTLRHILGEAKASMHLALPLVVAQISHISMSVVDNIMVGRLGPKPLAALAMAGTIFVFFFLFGLGILTAVRPMIAQADGADDHSKPGPLMRQALLLCIPLSIIAFVAFSFCTQFFILAKQKPELYPLAEEYLHMLRWGMPAVFGYICLRQLSEGMSNAAPSMWIAGLGALLNVPFNYCLILGKFGFPALGIKGAAVSTVSINWIMFFCFVFFIARSTRYQKYHLFKKVDWKNLPLLKEIVRLGIPIAGVRLGEVGFFMASALLMGILGTLPLASHQIAINFAALAFMMPLGISLAKTVRVAQAVGRGDQQGVLMAGWVGFLLGGMIMIPSAFIFWFFPDAISSFYTTNEEVKALARKLLKMAAVFQIFDGVQIVGIGILQGLKDTRIPFLAILLAFWIIGFPLCIYLGFYTSMGAVGIWLGIVIGLAIAAFLHMGRFRYLTKK